MIVASVLLLNVSIIAHSDESELSTFTDGFRIIVNNDGSKTCTIVGYESDIGVIERFDSIARFNAIQIFNRAMSILNSIISDIVNSDNTEYLNYANSNDKFYNDILIKKSADGAKKFIFNNHIMYVAQTMFPGSKSTDLDIETYYKSGNDYYTAKFISHKKYDVLLFMRFLCL